MTDHPEPVAPSSPSSTRRLRQVTGLMVSLGLTALLLSYLDLSQLLAYRERLTPGMLLGAAVLYSLLGLARALRFRALFQNHPPPALGVLFPVTLVHNFFIQVLPFRTGELAYPVLIRRHTGRSLALGIGNLLHVRLGDALIMSLGGGAGFLLISDWNHGAGREVALIFLTAGATLAGVLHFLTPLWRLTIRTTHLLRGLTPARFHPRLLKTATRLEVVAGQIHALHHPRERLRLIGGSLLVYAAMVAYTLWVLTSLTTLAPGLLFVITTLAFALSWFPLAVSGFGVVEGAWTLGLWGVGGMPLTEAVTIGFIMHGMQLLLAAITGWSGHLMLSLRKPPATSTP